jgi:hypothetical protein
MTELKRG